MQNQPLKMTLSELLQQQSNAYSNKPFLIFEQQPRKTDEQPYCQILSYQQFNEQVNRASHYLHDLGLKLGDVYNLHLPNSIAFMVLWFAGTRLGAIMMPTNVLASANEMTYLLEHSESKFAFTTKEHHQTLDACKKELNDLEQVILCDPCTHEPAINTFESTLPQYSKTPYLSPTKPQDLAAIMYTSGTTSKPKGVMVTHANYIKAGQTIADSLNIIPQDRQFIVLPLFHGNAQYYSTMSALLCGASIALMDRFSASQYFDKCIEYQATVASLFAAPMRMILAQPNNPAHQNNQLRSVIYAQNITKAQLKDWHTRFNAPLSQLWGMTETMGPPLMNPIEGTRKNWTIGKPIGGYQVKLVDSNNQETPQGQQGEIIVQGIPGETIMQGYFKNDEATNETIKNNWLYTGDNAIQDEQGYFQFVDRIKDMIKRSGENVAAGEVESILLDHPVVFECAVIGLPDEIRDEKIIATVVLNQNLLSTEQELITFCQQRLAAFKVPEQIIFLDELPKTSVGKIQKHHIRANLLNA